MSENEKLAHARSAERDQECLRLEAALTAAEARIKMLLAEIDALKGAGNAST